MLLALGTDWFAYRDILKPGGRLTRCNGSWVGLEYSIDGYTLDAGCTSIRRKNPLKYIYPLKTEHIATSAWIYKPYLKKLNSGGGRSNQRTFG